MWSTRLHVVHSVALDTLGVPQFCPVEDLG